MENILAFELADFRLSLAVMKAGQVVGSYQSDALYGQDAELLPEIERLLNQHKLTYHNLDLIATTKGPGSFTGLRVALATAQGLSLASGRPAVAFNSLEWVAKSFSLMIDRAEKSRHEAILTVLESRRKDVYCQLFDMNGEAINDPASLLPHELPDYIEKRSFVCIGSGVDKIKDELSSCEFFYPEHAMPTAKDLCVFAKQQVSAFGVSVFPCEPFYLRMPDVTISKT